MGVGASAGGAAFKTTGLALALGRAVGLGCALHMASRSATTGASSGGRGRRGPGRTNAGVLSHRGSEGSVLAPTYVARLQSILENPLFRRATGT